MTYRPELRRLCHNPHTIMSAALQQPACGQSINACQLAAALVLKTECVQNLECWAVVEIKNRMSAESGVLDCCINNQQNVCRKWSARLL